MENTSTFVERIVPDYRSNEPGIIVGTGGRHWLIIVDEQSWAENGAKHESKLEVLLRLGKLMPVGGWIEVTVDIHWDNNDRLLMVSRKYCEPFWFNNEVVYARA